MGESYLSSYYMDLLGREMRSYNWEYVMVFDQKKGYVWGGEGNELLKFISCQYFHWAQKNMIQ